MKDAIRVGIIGVGGTIGSTTAILAAEPNVELVALADPDPTRRKRVLDGIKGVRVFDDYRQMFDACDLDAVCIGLPTWMHAPVSQEALELGLHVLCEKPPSNDAAELIPVTHLAATKGLVYLISVSKPNPLGLGCRHRPIVLDHSVFLKKTFDIFSKMWFNKCITLADIPSVTARLRVGFLPTW